MRVQGPCATVDTACSSALVALDGAVLSLRAGACSTADSAIVAVANLLLVPIMSTLFARAGMLSPDGRCKSFDGRANGYVRCEGVGAAMLDSADGGEKLLVLSTAVRADGKSASLTAPNGTAQVHARL